MANALPKTSSAKPSNTLHSIFSSMYIKPVYEENIIREINLLDNSKCDDPYDISVKIIKLSKFIIAPKLCYLIIYCIKLRCISKCIKNCQSFSYL